MEPEQRIDIIDLLKYAIKKRYIKSSCDMKMDDPLRKISQRILSKMFPGATICKNRNRSCYNVSFVSGKQFSGDTTNYIREDRTTMVLPESLLNIRDAAKALVYEIPKQFLPFIYLLYENNNKHLPYHFAYNRESYRKGPWSKESIENILKHPDYTKEKLQDFITLLNSFHQGYNFIHAGNKDTLAPEKYGFSFNYGPPTSSWRRRYDYGRESEEKEIVRRFKEGSETLRNLETLQQTYKTYKAIKSHFNAQIRLAASFQQAMWYEIQQISRKVEARESLSPEEKANLYITEVTKQLNEWFGTEVLVVSKAEPQPIVEPKVEEDIENSRNIMVGDAMYNLDDVQNSFNEWLKNRDTNAE